MHQEIEKHQEVATNVPHVTNVYLITTLYNQEVEKYKTTTGQVKSSSKSIIQLMEI